MQKTLVLPTLPAFRLFISQHKATLLVLKIMFPNNGELSGTQVMRGDQFFPLPQVSSASLVTGQFFIIRLPDAEPGIDYRLKKKRVDYKCGCRHWTPQLSEQLGNWAWTLSSVYPMCWANVIIFNMIKVVKLCVKPVSYCLIKYSSGLWGWGVYIFKSLFATRVGSLGLRGAHSSLYWPQVTRGQFFPQDRSWGKSHFLVNS